MRDALEGPLLAQFQREHVLAIADVESAADDRRRVQAFDASSPLRACTRRPASVFETATMTDATEHLGGGPAFGIAVTPDGRPIRK
jgi:hypothetical protein